MFELKTVAVRPDGCYSVLCLTEGPQFGARPFAVAVEHTFGDFRAVLENGIFRCKRDFYHAGGYPTYEIIVPGHSLVKFHKGNTERDSRGCILVAESFAQFGAQAGVADSAGGFDEFMRLAGGVKEFDLVVSGRA